MGQSNWLIAKKKKKKVGLGNRNRIISTPKNKRFKTATKEKS
jgi:hypothetical protein